MKNNNEAIHSLAVLSAGVLWGITPIFVRNLSAEGLNPMQIGFFRMLVATLIIITYCLIRCRDKLQIELFSDIWMFAGTGVISLTLFNGCYFYASTAGDISVAVVLLYTSPVFIMLMSAIFFKEKINKAKIIALVLTICGCIFTAGVISEKGISPEAMSTGPLVLAAGIGAGFFYALYTIFGRIALKKYDPVTVTAWTMICALLGTFLLSNPLLVFDKVTSDNYLLANCVILGVVCTLLPYLLYTWGLNGVESGKASIIVAVEPIVGALIGFFMFGESHTAGKITGILLIIAAIIVINLQGKKQ